MEKSGDFKRQILTFNLYLQKPKSQKLSHSVAARGKIYFFGGKKGRKQSSYKTDEFTLLCHSTEMVRKQRILTLIVSVTHYKKETRPSNTWPLLQS